MIVCFYDHSVGGLQSHPETGDTLVIARLGHRELGWHQAGRS
jgi:hypothetical protein